MSISYQDLRMHDSCQPVEECRNPGRRKQASKHKDQSDLAKTREYDWESKETEKIHHNRFCKAVKHADGLNERFAYVEFPFQIYWSRIQEAYHVGRNRKMDTEAAIEFLRHSRSRERLRTLEARHI